MNKQKENLIKRFGQWLFNNKFKLVVILLVLGGAGYLGRFYLAPTGFGWQNLTGTAPPPEPNVDSMINQAEPKNETVDLMVGPLKNEFSIRVKVITKKRHIRCSSEPNGIPDGQELNYFHPYFVFETRPSIDNPDLTYYLIGPTPKEVDKLGWVSSDDVQRWDTRVGDRYDRPIDANGNYLDVPVPALYIYRTREDAIASLTDRTIQPLAEARLNYKSRPLMAWPIISAPEKVTVNNRTYEIHPNGFLAAYEPGSNVSNPDQAVTPASAQDKEKKARTIVKVSAGVKQMDVVFVIDSTLSMTPYIAKANEAVKKITNGLKSSKSFQPDIAFGAVEYRDYVENLTFADSNAFYIHPFTKDVTAFLQDMDNLKAATVDSVDYAEAVFDGLRGAIESMAWRDLAEKIIILIGDDPSHGLDSERNPNQLTAQGIIGLANGKRIVIFSLMAPTTGGQGSQAEKDEHASQFNFLAASTFFAAESKKTGSCHSLEKAEDVVPIIEQVFTQGIEIVNKTDKIVTGIVSGDIDIRTAKPVVRNPNLRVSDEQITEVLKFLSSVGVDGKELMPGEITFSTGWVVTESDNQVILKKQVYLARDELQALMGELWGISQTLGYRAQDAPDIFKKIVESLTEGSFLKSETDLSMDTWLMVKGIPVHPNSVLAFSKEELFSMSEDRRLVLKDKIMKNCWPLLLNALNNQPIVYFPDPDPLSFGWIDEEFLP